jgi:predicted kinase
MSDGPPVLVVVGGLPATGKSTIAGHLAWQVRAPYLRVDRIEQAIVSYSPLEHPIGAAGYAVAHALAGEQLSLGLDVIVECVNPIGLTRDGWVATAVGADAAIVEVEVVCSDPAEHRRRAHARASDVEGLVKPTWEEILRREYDPWNRPHLIIDSATTAARKAADLIAAEISSARERQALAAIPDNRCRHDVNPA